MNFLEYQIEADRTRNLNDDEELNAILGLIGETGEIVDLYKKLRFHDHDRKLTEKKISEEIGDLLWYLSLLSRCINKPLSEIAEGNVAKLKKRYPLGFSPERSRNRE